MKWIIALLAAGGVYTAASYYTGSQIEGNLDALFNDQAEMFKAAGYQVDISDLKRGIFTSTAKFTLSQAELIEASGNLKIYHGPVLFKGGLGIGSMSSLGQFESVSIAGEPFPQISYLKQAEFITRVGFSDSVKAIVKFPEYQGDFVSSAKIDFAGSELVIDGSTKTQRGDFKLVIGDAKITAPDGVEVLFKAAQGQGDYYAIAPGVILQNFAMTMPSIKMAAGNINQDFELRDFTIKSDYAVEGSEINNGFTATIAAVDGLYPIKDFAVNAKLLQIPVNSWATFATVNADILDDSIEPQVLQTKIMQALNALVDRSSVQVNLTADVVGAPVALNYDAKLARALTIAEVGEDFDFSQLQSAMAMNVDVSIGKAVMEKTPLGMLLMMGGKADALVDTGDAYTMSMSMSNGQTLINGQLVDAAALDEHAAHDHSDPNHVH